MIQDDFKSKDIVHELIQINAMYISIVKAYEEYTSKMKELTPQERIRSIMIVVLKPTSFDSYVDKIMNQDAEGLHGDVVLMDLGVEIKRVRGALKSFKPKDFQSGRKNKKGE